MKLKNLTHDAKKFIELQVFFTGLTAILSLFVNTFLLNSFGSYSREVLLYNVILAVVQPLAMVTSVFAAKAKNALLTQRIGLTFYSLALVVLCIFGERISFLYPLFAVMLSFGAGYYWTTYSGQMFCYTMDGNRDLIAGITGFFASAVSILLPFSSGILIGKFGKVTGYRIVFGIAAALSVGAYLTNRHLPKLPQISEKPSFSYVIKTILRSPNGRRIMAANALCDCRGGTLPIFVTLLFYNLMPDEMMISLNGAIGNLVAVLGAAMYGAFIISRNRVRASIAASVAVMLPAIGMLFGQNIAIIMIFNAVNGFFGTFISTPVLNTHFRVMEDLDFNGEYGPEIHTFREVFVALGRVAGLAIVWAVPKTNIGAVIVVLFLSLTALLDTLLLRSIERDMKKQKSGSSEKKEKHDHTKK